MINITLPQANSLYHSANIILILGAFLVLLGTIVAIWSGGIRERFADERLSNNEAETERAKADAAQANARAAEVNLELAKLQAPRSLTDEQATRIIAKLKPFAGQQFKVTAFWDIKESLSCGSNIYHASWGGVEIFKPVSGTVLLGGVVGVLVYVNPRADGKTKDAANSLASALNIEGISAELRAENADPNNIININVGTKS